MNVETEARVAIGKIVKPFGVEGFVVVQTMTDSPSRFRRLHAVYIGTNASTALVGTVEKSKIGPRGVRMKLAGVDDRTAAEHLVGSLLFVTERERVRLPKGHFFIHDVIGMKVVDETRGDVGTVSDVLKYPAHDVYVVALGDTSYMIPAVKEIVRHFDTTAKVLTVRLVDGLLEEQEGVVA